MKQLILLTAAFLMLGLWGCLIPIGTIILDRQDQSRESKSTFLDSSWDDNVTFMRPYKNNAYGPGIHSDATGKPFQWRTRNGRKVIFDRVKPDAYGLGVGMDQYGGAVKPSPWGR